MSSERRRSFWGWGWADYEIDHQQLKAALEGLPYLIGMDEPPTYTPCTIPDPHRIPLRPPRFELPQNILEFSTNENYERLAHTYGKCFVDIVNGLLGKYENPPDYVSYPRSELHLQQLLDFAKGRAIALIPYGGGSTVAKGIEGPKSTTYKGFISVDMCRMNQVIEVNADARWIRVQPGLYGPELESQLKQHNLTLRHFPQSFEFSTVGGWVATRGQGHFATALTHIDEFVEGVRIVTPAATFQSRHLPASGAGPSMDRMMIGSEGVFGFITEIWLKCMERPKFRSSTTISFENFYDGVHACRKLSQSGLNPTQCRLVDEKEAFMMGLGSGESTMLLLGFESATCEQYSNLQSALSICKQQGGSFSEETIHKSKGDEGERDGAAGEWRKSFLAAPYLRDELIRHGFISETYETAITWDRFPSFHEAMIRRVRDMIQKTCNGLGMITCRFTAVYPSGAAPYYTVLAWCGDQREMVAKWELIKEAASDVISEYGATITHHHSVGRYHMPWYKKEIPPFYAQILRAVKSTVDPEWIMNPGVLLDEPELPTVSKL
eukprot:TRINITY_DN9279_c0_g1_i1.p1 TRINITY_DN9279_c0_g1~~TRINITY_DN9279_c0_g1_i1.p1  ORF type:complete len:551 (-),score=92.01 TRINITY_DN9279_c0_g1_i1:111-1763(-)